MVNSDSIWVANPNNNNNNSRNCSHRILDRVEHGVDIHCKLCHSSGNNSSSCSHCILDRVEHGVDSLKVLEWEVSRELVGLNVTVATGNWITCMGRDIFVIGVTDIFTAPHVVIVVTCGRNVMEEIGREV